MKYRPIAFICPMKKRMITLFVLAAIATGCGTTSSHDVTGNNSGELEETQIRIMFGSCGHHDKPQPLLALAAEMSPDAFVFLGDNIYGDTRNMDSLRARYSRLNAKKEFQNLWKATTVYSVWDDHDFGENDAGRHYPFRKESEAIFLDFWKVPENSERRTHDGIYGSEYIEKNGKKIQLIMLDTRYFRDDLVFRKRLDIIGKNDYKPNMNADSTVLGEAQWTWLKAQLEQPADFRIIASSIQFGHEYNGWESWTNVPHEQQRFIDLIKETGASRVMFISGDVHWGEISKMKTETTYPIYDITSSGITQSWHNVEPNKNRIGEAVRQNNLGLIELHFKGDELQIEVALIDSTAEKIEKHKIPSLEISF